MSRSLSVPLNAKQRRRQRLPWPLRIFATVIAGICVASASLFALLYVLFISDGANEILTRAVETTVRQAALPMAMSGRGPLEIDLAAVRLLRPQWNHWLRLEITGVTAGDGHGPHHVVLDRLRVHLDLLSLLKRRIAFRALHGGRLAIRMPVDVPPSLAVALGGLSLTPFADINDWVMRQDRPWSALERITFDEVHLLPPLPQVSPAPQESAKIFDPDSAYEEDPAAASPEFQAFSLWKLAIDLARPSQGLSLTSRLALRRDGPAQAQFTLLWDEKTEKLTGQAHLKEAPFRALFALPQAYAPGPLLNAAFDFLFSQESRRLGFAVESLEAWDPRSLPKIGAQAPLVRKVALSGAVTDNQLRIENSQAWLHNKKRDDLLMHFSGEWDFTQGPFRFTFMLPELSFQELGQNLNLIPLRSVQRTWNRLSGVSDPRGTITDVQLTLTGRSDLAAQKVRDADFFGQLSFADTALKLPRIDLNVRKGQGTATFNAQGIIAQIAQIEIEGSTQAQARAEIPFDGDGAIAITAQLRNADMLPLFSVLTGDPPPFAFTGRAQGPIAVTIPLRDDAQPPFSLSGNLVSDRLLVTHDRWTQPLELRAPTIAFDDQALRITSAAALGDFAFALSWRRELQRARSPQALRQTLEITWPQLTWAQAQGLGWPDSWPRFAGSLAGDLSAEIFKGGRQNINLRGGITDLGLAIPFLSLEKERGEPGEFMLSLELADWRLQALPSFMLNAPGLEIEATADFAQGRLERLHFDRLTLGAQKLAGTTLKRIANGWHARLHRARIDLEPWLDRLRAPKDPEQDQAQQQQSPAYSTPRLGDWLKGHRLELDLSALQALRINSELTLKELHGHAEIIHGEIGNLALDSALHAADDDKVAGHLALDLKSPERGGQFTLRSDNLGLLLRGATPTRAILGGSIDMHGQTQGLRHGQNKAQIQARNFRIRDLPEVVRLLSWFSLEGIVNLLSGGRFAVQNLRADIAWQGPQLEIQSLFGYSDALGFSTAGGVNFKDKSLNLQGTLIPAATLNRVIASIPVIGTLLSGDGRGLIATDYRLRGGWRDPQISINPLTALAPGIIGRLVSEITKADPQKNPSGDAPAGQETPTPSVQE